MANWRKFTAVRGQRESRTESQGVAGGKEAVTRVQLGACDPCLARSWVPDHGLSMGKAVGIGGCPARRIRWGAPQYMSL